MSNNTTKNYNHLYDAEYQYHQQKCKELQKTLPQNALHSYLQYPSDNPNQRANVDMLNRLIRVIYGLKFWMRKWKLERHICYIKMHVI